MTGPGGGGEPDIRVFDDAEAAGRAAAEVIAGAVRDAVGERGRADWATTGGSTPRAIYMALATEPLRPEVPWRDLHVWWGDDRYVPRDHPFSNVLPLDQILVSASAKSGQSGTGEDAARVEVGETRGVMLAADHIHAPRMSDAIGSGRGLEWAALEYDRELHAAGLPSGPNGFPAFDVLFLGIGPDGHVLSAFPGSPLFDTHAWVSAVDAPTHVEPHVPRLSLNPAVVAAARLPIVVAHGAGKAEILASVFGSERDERRWPAQLARRAGAIWFLDRAAAASLPA